MARLTGILREAIAAGALVEEPTPELLLRADAAIRRRWPEALEPARVRVFEDLEAGLMVTVYSARRAGEVGAVGFVPYAEQRPATRPGGSAMR